MVENSAKALKKANNGEKNSLKAKKTGLKEKLADSAFSPFSALLPISAFTSQYGKLEIKYTDEIHYRFLVLCRAGHVTDVFDPVRD